MFRNIYVCTYIHVITINEKKWVMNLKVSKEGYIEGFVGQRGREKHNYIIISKIKNVK